MEKTRLSDQLGRGSHWGLKGRGLPPLPHSLRLYQPRPLCLSFSLQGSAQPSLRRLRVSSLGPLGSAQFFPPSTDWIL